LPDGKRTKSCNDYSDWRSRILTPDRTRAHSYPLQLRRYPPAPAAQNYTACDDGSACDDLDVVGIFFHFADVLGEAAIAALAALVAGDGFEQMDSPEIGPQHIG